MPIIEFYCKSCQHKFEELVLKDGDLSSLKCPECKSKELVKLFSTFRFRSNGSFSSNAGVSCTGCSKDSCAGCSQEKEAK